MASGDKNGFWVTPVFVSVAVLGLTATAAGALWRQGREEAAPGVKAWGVSVGGLSRKEVAKRLEKKRRAFLRQKVKLTAGPKNYRTTWGELGVDVDVRALTRSVMEVGRKGALWTNLVERQRARKGLYSLTPGFSLDRKRALKKLKQIQEKTDRRARKGRLNLRNRKVVPGKEGYRLHLHASMAQVLKAARFQKTTVAFKVETLKPRITGEMAKKLDISMVMGWYETTFKSTGKYRHRAQNLQVAARKLNGWVIFPGEIFSFNEALGPRTRQEGYRVAPVISAGETVDGMAGGTCQISSTLHAAAYFAGLDIVEADVHSQPSHYIELGLDATVVWPDTDLKLKNPYDFPVVLHYEVAFGRVRTEILGKKRLYTIGFERRITKQRPYREIFREDPEMPLGKKKIEQRGEFGYHVRRRRVFFDKNGNELKAQYWTLVYPPTNLIVRKGTKPPENPLALSPDALPQEDPRLIPPKPTPDKFVRIKQ